MIVDSLPNHRLYHALGPRLAAGLEYLATLDPGVEDGRHPIRGDEVFALVQSYETGPATDKRFESHRLHLDVQYLLSGRERILHAPAPGLPTEVPYDEGKDVEFYQEPGASSSLLLRPGDFCILHPHDAHKPGCMAGGRDVVRKIVVKVRL